MRDRVLSRFLKIILITVALLCISACGKKQEKPIGTVSEKTAEQTAEQTEKTKKTSASEIENTAESEDNKQCSHDSVSFEITSELSCTSAGAYRYICTDCGAIVSAGQIPKTGHSYSWQSDENEHWKYCSICGDKTESEKHSLDKNNVCTVCGYGCRHKYKEEVTEPGCLTEGYKTHICEYCGHTYKDSFTKATGHSFQISSKVDASCVSDGKTVYKCSRCGELVEVAIPASGHTIVTDNAVEATCQHPGLTKGSHCSTCGEVISEQTEIPVTDHLFLEGVCVYCGAEAPEEKEPVPYELPEIEA